MRTTCCRKVISDQIWLGRAKSMYVQQHWCQSDTKLELSGSTQMIKTKTCVSGWGAMGLKNAINYCSICWIESQHQSVYSDIKLYSVHPISIYFYFFYYSIHIYIL